MARRKTMPKPKEVMTESNALFLPRCPLCDAPVTTQATVEKFGAPQGWTFYGTAGERWIKCRGESGVHPFVHFITLINGRSDHRLAWIKPEVKPVGVQETLL
jgi:hypothetical protein